MAIAFQSSQTKAFGSSSTAVVTKPVSLAVGDLMVAHIVAVQDNVSDIGLPSLWTEITSLDSGSVVTRVAYKIADSGDVSASNFTFTFSGSCLNGASIARITGASTNFTTGTYSSTTTQSSHVYTGGITPPFANSLLFFVNYFNDQGGGATNTASNYAIVTSNPSWTEAYDFGTGTSPGLAMSLAYAIRPEITATGNFSVDSSTSCDGRGVLIAIAPIVDATANPTVISLLISVVAPLVSLSLLPDVISRTLNIIAPTVSAPASKVRNQAKSAVSTVHNEPKT